MQIVKRKLTQIIEIQITLTVCVTDPKSLIFLAITWHVAIQSNAWAQHGLKSHPQHDREVYTCGFVWKRFPMCSCEILGRTFHQVNSTEVTDTFEIGEHP